MIIVKAWFGVLYGQYSTRGEVERPIQHEAKPSALLCLETSPLVLYCPYSTNKPCFKCFIVICVGGIQLKKGIANQVTKKRTPSTGKKMTASIRNS